jgi:hypothetical protein
MRSLPIALAMCLSITFHSQNDSTNNRKFNHEISIIAYTLYSTPAYSYDENSIVGFAPSGIQYKFIIQKKHAFRLCLEYDVNNPNTNKIENRYTHSLTGKEYNGQFRFGYERIFRNAKKIKPYLFTDIGYQHTDTDIKQSVNSSVAGMPSSISYYDSSNFISQKINSCQLFLGGGVKFFASKNIFCSIETCFGINYYTQIKQSYSRTVFTNGINGAGNYTYEKETPNERNKSNGFIFVGNIFRFSIGILI